jgi:hypothetical protein
LEQLYLAFGFEFILEREFELGHLTTVISIANEHDMA